MNNLIDLEKINSELGTKINNTLIEYSKFMLKLIKKI